MGAGRRSIAVAGLALILALLAETSRAETGRAEYRTPADRALAATWLGRLQSRAAVDTLVRLLADPDGAVRLAAVEALEAIDDSRAVATLERLAGDPDQEQVEGVEPFDGSFTRYGREVFPTWPHAVRDAARRAHLRLTTPLDARPTDPPPPEPGTGDVVDLGEIPASRRVSVTRALLIEVGKPEPDWRSFKAAYQLGRLREKQAVPSLLRMLAHEYVGGFASHRGAASWHQSMAGWALVRIADPASVPAIRALALDAERPEVVRCAALLAWARLDGDGAQADVRRIFLETSEDDDSIELSWRFGPFAWARRSTMSGPIDEFPSFSRLRQAATWALADISYRAGNTLVESLSDGKPVSWTRAMAIERVSVGVLDAWSRKRLVLKDEARGNAVSIRYDFFPDTTADLVLGILEARGDPLLVGTLDFLRDYPLRNARVSRELRRLLGRAVESGTCNERLRLVDALGRQGDEVAELALIEFAARGEL